MANVGRVTLEQDGDMYIELKEIHYSKRDSVAVEDQENLRHNDLDDGDGTTPMELLRKMQDVKKGVDEQLQRRAREVTLFGGSAAVSSEGDGETDNASYEDDQDEDENEDGEENEDDLDSEGGYDDSELGEGYDEVDGEEEDNEEEEEKDDEEQGSDEDEDEDEVEDEEDSDNGSDRERPNGRRFALESGLVDEAGERKYQLNRLEATEDIMQTVYGPAWNAPASSKRQQKKSRRDSDGDDTDDDDDDELFVPKGRGQTRNFDNDLDALDSNRITPSYLQHFVLNRVSQSNSNKTGVLENEKERAIQSYFQGTVDHNTSLVQRFGEVLSSSSKHAARRGVGYAALKSRFVTGGYGQGREGGDQDGDDAEEGLVGDDEDGAGDWEDLEATGNASSSKASNSKSRAKSSKDEDEDSDEENERLDEELRQLYAQKKAAFKASFDDKYDKKKRGEGSDDEGEGGDGEGHKNRKKKGTKDVTDDAELDAEDGFLAKVQADLQSAQARNKLEFQEDSPYLQQQYLGHVQGRYVRIVIKDMPRHLLDNFNKRRPMILGGLLNSEVATGFVVARIKRHRWNKGVLKSGDPLIISIGWRRYQSLPVFFMPDDTSNPRSRFLKYTPEHMHCQVCFYGPLVPPNTALFAYKAFSQNTLNYRVAMTGVTLEQRTNAAIVKKLKLVGTPVKIFKNTAFVTGMFNSELEVAKFEHVKIKTVSGIRGTIKKAITNPAQVHGGKAGSKGLPKVQPGTFRATFEDKILMR